jgi:hypothetical protein
LDLYLFLYSDFIGPSSGHWSSISRTSPWILRVIIPLEGDPSARTQCTFGMTRDLSLQLYSHRSAHDPAVLFEIIRGDDLCTFSNGWPRAGGRDCGGSMSCGRTGPARSEVTEVARCDGMPRDETRRDEMSWDGEW